MKKFLENKRFLSFLILTVICLVSGSGIVAAELKVLAAGPFALSIACVFRLITYKSGNIPFFMRDKTWQTYRLKYSEEAEEKFKEISLKRATTYFKMAVISFPIWILVEALNAIR